MALQRTGDRGPRKVAVPNLSGMTRTQYQAALTAAGLTYTESSTTTGDSGIDQTIVSQGVAAGEVVLVGSNVSVNYYQYVYPGFSHYAAFGHYAGFYHGFYHSFAHYAGFGHYAGFYHSFGHYAGFYHGFYHSFGHYGGFGHYAGFSHYGSFSHAYGGFATVGYGGIYPSYPGFVSLGAITGVHTTEGIKQAQEIQVGDKLWSLDIANLDPSTLGIPNFTADESTFEALGVVETTVVSVNSHLMDMAWVINGDLFTSPHLVLTKDSEGVVKFRRADSLSTEFQVWDLENRSWEPITSYEHIAYIEYAYTINCEPYDIFFTNNMLVHDSISWATNPDGSPMLDADGKIIFPGDPNL